MAMRINYMEELDSLRRSVKEMGEAVEASFDQLLSAVDNKDEDLEMKIISGDRVINDMERNIESRCLSLITRQQPIAGDLRMISAALKVVTDIERIGDQTADIAELMLRMKGNELDLYSRHITGMLGVAKEIVHDAVDAFVDRDSKAADEVIRHDDVVDELFSKVKDDLVRRLQEGVSDVDACVDVLLIAKYLERIGDHAVNIAEWELFQESGSIKDIRLM
ncbi:MAG TPA: phosphate signaling complex protein PhoU [Candidatus Eisenbergiella stercorigallinarum]|uniref:Phosphate-specific transport system accessory protein PhoU n=1 Tax=Candidatus Eisenbergiella stercorigallinarum TaxID=2838557 RepID=A0A9D2QX75_9FIRM|nr:phosphate signaling complex protein PhoU [Candidatus Eisenbergiella stercorigallinarum]